MQFLSITAVLLNLVLIQDVAAVNAVKAAIPNPMCQYRPDNCVANDCNGAGTAICCGTRLYCWGGSTFVTRLV
ncbi:hypothetical protein EG327_002884 [Venturia inaequalis]|uniref:Uncharacterized protein n=1 Tax=Venturia inaequalis TaxID=5025 RepID=A0A8H3ZAM9_VENIN|nr:hypothetical protein EG327_002884 [Venturia inaequalis]